MLPSLLSAQLVWHQKPQDYQLFPRNETNSSEVKMIGQLLNTESDSLILLIKTSEGNTDTLIEKFSNHDSIKPFNFTFQIKAGLIDYQFIFLNNKAGHIDTMSIISHVCCGDAILICGQSNAFAVVKKHEGAYQPIHQFVRSFGKPFSDKSSNFD